MPEARDTAAPQTPKHDPERLKVLASNLEVGHGNNNVYSEALYAAAAEIETLKLTVEATTKLANRAAVQSVLDTRLRNDTLEENARLHGRVVELSNKLKVAQFSRGY